MEEMRVEVALWRSLRGSCHCMQAEAGYRAHRMWDLPIGCSSEYPQSHQLMILKTTDLPRLLAELQATACQKQCYAKIFQHFQQLTQCFFPLWFCYFRILCTQTHSWIHLTGQALTVKINFFNWKLLKTSVFEKVQILSILKHFFKWHVINKWPVLTFNFKSVNISQV